MYGTSSSLSARDEAVRARERLLLVNEHAVHVDQPGVGVGARHGLRLTTAGAPGRPPARLLEVPGVLEVLVDEPHRHRALADG